MYCPFGSVRNFAGPRHQDHGHAVIESFRDNAVPCMADDKAATSQNRGMGYEAFNPDIVGDGADFLAGVAVGEG